MINISDIAVSLKNKINNFNKYDEFYGYLDHCLFEEHPFPILERYIKETNTQFFVDLRDMKNNFDEKEAAKYPIITKSNWQVRKGDGTIIRP